MSVRFKAVASGARLMALVALVSFLAACSRDNRGADIKKCIAEVQRAASQGLLDQMDLLSTQDSAEEHHDKLGGAVSDCMSKAGYNHANADMTDVRCVYDVSFNPYCYRRGN